MAQEEKKRGFFDRFRKSTPAASTPASPVPKPQPAAPKAAPPARVPEKVESKTAAPVGKNPFSPSAPEPSAPLATSGSSIDTVEAFNQMCQALVDINKSQVQIVNMALTMLSNSIKKIAEGINTADRQ
ncbi:MAG: hypothetical protein HGB36_01340 [Chlorobiaceae bacterium]|jgi:hypothetical protein|nr:hypothetical protein [Chlorobiaceae bacterium]